MEKRREDILKECMAEIDKLKKKEKKREKKAIELVFKALIGEGHT